MSQAAVTKERPLRVAVIGGGIAGLCLAVPLARAQESGVPIDVHVYEAAAKFGEIGAGLMFAQNAQRVLDKLGLKSALDAVMDIGADHANVERRDTWFDFRQGDARVPIEKAFLARLRGRNAGTGNVYRADFLDQLVRAFPADKASFRHRFTGYSQDPEGDSRIMLSFEGGKTATADVLLGCDGVKSRVRRCLFAKSSLDPEEESKATRAKYSGWVAYRGLAPFATVDDAVKPLMGPGLMWVGYGRHFLHYAVKKGKLVNIVMFVRDREGKRAIGKDGPWTEAAPQAQILNDYESFNDICKTLVKAVAKPTAWGIFDIPELPWYTEGRVGLVGDAAHATTPHQGAGAGQCVEDAFILSRLLTDPSILNPPSSNGDWKETVKLALQAYSHVRRPRATKVQRTSAEAGMLYEYQLPGVLDNLEKFKEKMNGRLDWIWEWDEESALQEAFDFVAAARSIYN